MTYSFEHGIDHCGQQGVAPLLVVGGPVTDKDFEERDLTAVRGVKVSQHGLPRGARWKDLNLALLFRRLPPIEYFYVEFDGAVRLADLGSQPRLRILAVDCPGAKAREADRFPSVESAHVRWTDDCTALLLDRSVRRLTLIRPKIADLRPLAHLAELVELDVHYASSLTSLTGLAQLTNLYSLGLHACPNLMAVGLEADCAGPKELTAGGCRNFANLMQADRMLGLRKLSLLECAQEVVLPIALKGRGVELDVNPSRITWVNTTT